MRTLRRLLTKAWKAVKIPVLVAGLVVAGAVTTSQVVLWKLPEEQESNLRETSGCSARKSVGPVGIRNEILRSRRDGLPPGGVVVWAVSKFTLGTPVFG
jgi:hypothetical protein